MVICWNWPVAEIQPCINPPSHNAPFWTETCTCMHIFLSQNGALWDICLVHWGIRAMGLLTVFYTRPSSVWVKLHVYRCKLICYIVLFLCCFKHCLFGNANYCLYYSSKRPTFAPKHIAQIAKIMWSISIRHRSDSNVSDRCLIDVDRRIVAIWMLTTKNQPSTYDKPTTNQNTSNCMHILRGIHVLYKSSDKNRVQSITFNW